MSRKRRRRSRGGRKRGRKRGGEVVGKGNKEKIEKRCWVEE